MMDLIIWKLTVIGMAICHEMDRDMMDACRVLIQEFEVHLLVDCDLDDCHMTAALRLSIQC